MTKAKYDLEDREKVIRAVLAGQTKAAVARRYGIPRSTVSLWVRQAGIARGNEPAPARRGAPAAEMPPEDRRRILSVVRDLHETLRVTASRLKTTANEGEAPNLNRDTAAACQALARAAREVLDAHPGILATAALDERDKAALEELKRWQAITDKGGKLGDDAPPPLDTGRLRSALGLPTLDEEEDAP